MQEIEDHIARLMGTKPKVTFEDEKNPDWEPPPYFDVRDIHDPKLREEWMLSEQNEIDGILNKRKCAEEHLLKRIADRHR